MGCSCEECSECHLKSVHKERTPLWTFEETSELNLKPNRQ